MAERTDPRDFDAEVSSLAALGDPLRRSLYKFVVQQSDPVSRDQAAAGLEIAHHVAKFHLDKLVEDGLLEVEYRRPPGRSGPGAGRPAKLYRRASRAIAVSLPERRYDLVGQVLAEALTAAATTGEPVAEALHRAAAGTGRALAAAAPAAATRSSRAQRVRSAHDVLAANGYEPRSDGAGITLANCPFHKLAQQYTSLVCTMNLDLITALLDGLGDTTLQARLDPSPGRCCVTVGMST
jgi:predicted ArsR family transcriptional regulator